MEQRASYTTILQYISRLWFTNISTSVFKSKQCHQTSPRVVYSLLHVFVRVSNAMFPCQTIMVPRVLHRGDWGTQCFCSACSDQVIRSLNRPLPNNQNIQLVIFASLVINYRRALSFDWVFNVMSSSVVYEEVCCILYGHPSSLSRLDSKAFKLSPT